MEILQLLDTTSKEKLKEKACFLTPAQINDLYDLVEDMCSEIEDMNFWSWTKKTNNSNVYTYNSLPNKDEIGITTTRSVHICLFKSNNMGSKTEIFLFMTEVFNLLKYINLSFGFSTHPSFCNNEISACDNFKREDK